MENLYNPLNVVVNPRARKGYKGTGIAALGVRDAGLDLINKYREAQENLRAVGQRAKNIGKSKEKSKGKQRRQIKNTAARGGLVRSSFPDRLTQIMRYR